MLIRDNPIKRCWISVMAILCVLPSLGATNPQITRLMNEKNQKMAKLEQCAKKVNGFKIAGISTLGLTAAGVAGNVVLSGKKKGLETELASTQKSLESEEKKKSELETKIAAEEKRIAEEKRKKELEDKKSECDAQPNKEWKNEECVVVATATNTASQNNANQGDPNATSGETRTEEQIKAEKEACGKGDKAGKEEWNETENKCVPKTKETNSQNNKNSEQEQKSSLQECLERRKGMSAEVRACCYVGANVAKGDEKSQKCNCVNGGTFKFDENNISKPGTCEVAAEKDKKCVTDFQDAVEELNRYLAVFAMARRNNRPYYTYLQDNMDDLNKKIAFYSNANDLSNACSDLGVYTSKLKEMINYKRAVWTLETIQINEQQVDISSYRDSNKKRRAFVVKEYEGSPWYSFRDLCKSLGGEDVTRDYITDTNGVVYIYDYQFKIYEGTEAVSYTECNCDGNSKCENIFGK